jgi:hypothetical protein
LDLLAIFAKEHNASHGHEVMGEGFGPAQAEGPVQTWPDY